MSTADNTKKYHDYKKLKEILANFDQYYDGIISGTISFPELLESCMTEEAKAIDDDIPTDTEE